MKSHKLLDRCTALLLAFALLLSLAACSNGASATTMHLKHTEGTVAVSDEAGEAVELLENLGLYSGYGVGTRSESYAWINLDDVKLTKMDQESEIAIQKEGKRLEINVKSGALFFNVTEPLAEDESMDIRTSTMVVGIRGTCGWVEVPDAEHMNLYLLEGTVECSVGDKTVTVHAGETAAMTADGEITVTAFTAPRIPAFVRKEIEDDDGLLQAILAASGIDVTGGDLDDYADILDDIRSTGSEILYTEVLDFEADGKPELLVIENAPEAGDYITIRIWRKGMVGNPLIGSSAMSYNVNGIGITSLVEYGGRLFIRIQRIQTYPNSPGAFHTETSYLGSVAREEGSHEDWGWVDVFGCSQYESGTHYSRRLHDEHGFTGVDEEELTAEEFAAAQAQYKELKVLVYYTSDGGSIVLPDPSEVGEFPQPAVTGAEPAQPEPDETALPTDGDRIVLQGTIGTYTYNEVLALQGVSDPNAGYSDTSQTFRLIVLDTPQTVTAISGDELDSYSGEAQIINVSHARGLDQGDGQHLIFSIDPNAAWWPSDTSLPLGEPRADDIHVLEATAAAGPDRPAGNQTGLPFTEGLEMTSYTGAGGYHDYFNLEPDGTYEEGYSERTSGESHTGRFETVTLVNDHTWSMTVAEAEDSYVAIGTEYRLYGPGTPLSEIPEFYQIVLENQDRAGYQVLSGSRLTGYVICNTADDYGYSTLWGEG